MLAINCLLDFRGTNFLKEGYILKFKSVDLSTARDHQFWPLRPKTPKAYI